MQINIDLFVIWWNCITQKLDHEACGMSNKIKETYVLQQRNEWSTSLWPFDCIKLMNIKLRAVPIRLAQIKIYCCVVSQCLRYRDEDYNAATTQGPLPRLNCTLGKTMCHWHFDCRAQRWWMGQSYPQPSSIINAMPKPMNRGETRRATVWHQGGGEMSPSLCSLGFILMLMLSLHFFELW